MVITGIAGLSSTQRVALDNWLSEYTLNVIKFGQGLVAKPNGATSPVRPSIVVPSSGHWIKSKSNNGLMIILEDGSMWETYSLDRIYTGLWLPITNITVLGSSAPFGDYKYLLINKDDGEKALAKYLGRE